MRGWKEYEGCTDLAEPFNPLLVQEILSYAETTLDGEADACCVGYTEYLSTRQLR